MNDEIKEPNQFGDPILMVSECELIDTVKIAIRCGQCSTAFRFALENDSIKACPKCRTKYSHATLIARNDDLDALREFIDILDPDEDAESIDDNRKNEGENVDEEIVDFDENEEP